MPKLIQDEFSGKRISRQRRYQLRREAANRCRICGEKPGPLCAKHIRSQQELTDRKRRRREAADLI